MIPNLENISKCLFHYTNLDALHSIVENKCLWLTNLYYLNDSLEIKYAAHLFKDIIRNWEIEEIGGNELKKHAILGSPLTVKQNFHFQLEDWVTSLSNTVHHIFSISFSEKGDSLSQWRGYSKHGSGVSLGFYKEDLGKLADNNDFILKECYYDVIKQRDFLAGMLLGMYEYFKSSKETTFDSTRPKGQEYFSFFDKHLKLMMLTAFAFIKHPSFSEEKEWRLVSKHYENYAVSEIKFRPAATTMIPYIELKLKPLHIEKSQVGNALFRCIYVGPSSNFEIKHQSISHYLSNKKACNTTMAANQSLREI